KNYRGLKCYNCDHTLDISDKFCPNCGQKNSTKRLSLKDFVDEFLANFYAYDSKVKHTIVSLFSKPGKADREFINGSRQFYANPFRFYLSVSLLYFIFSGIVNKFSDDTIVDLEETIIKKEVEQKPKNKVKPSEENSPIQIGGKINLADTIKKTKLYSEKQIADFGFFKRTARKIETYANFFDHSTTTNPVKILDSLKHEKSKWNLFLLRKTYQTRHFSDQDATGTRGIEKFGEFIEEKAPFILFVSLP